MISTVIFRSSITSKLNLIEFNVAAASQLVRSTPEQAVRVQALAGDTVLCSWARHFTLTVPLSTQVYKWVPANLMLGGNPAMDHHTTQGEIEILSIASCYRHRDKLWPDGPLLARMQTLPCSQGLSSNRPQRPW